MFSSHRQVGFRTQFSRQVQGGLVLTAVRRMVSESDLPMATYGDYKMTSHDKPWQAMTSHDKPWQAMTSHDKPWQAMTSHDKPWQAMTSHDKLPPIERTGACPSIKFMEGNNRKHDRRLLHVATCLLFGDEVDGTTTGERVILCVRCESGPNMFNPSFS